MDHLVRSLQQRRRGSASQGPWQSSHLMKNSNFVGNSTAISAGLAPQNPVDLGSHARPVLTLHRSITH